MRKPLSIAIAVIAAAIAARATEPAVAGRVPQAPPPARTSPEAMPANHIPTEPGATAEAVGQLADDPSPEGHRKFYDGGANLTVGNKGVKGTTGATIGSGQPASKPKVPDVGPVKAAAAPAAPSGPFWDDKTVGFAALGILAGGMIGIGLSLMFALGPFGPLIGAAIGAALLVGLFKWKGYKKPGDTSGGDS